MYSGCLKPSFKKQTYPHTSINIKPDLTKDNLKEWHLAVGITTQLLPILITVAANITLLITTVHITRRLRQTLPSKGKQ